MLEQLTYDMLEPLVDRKFRVRGEFGSFEALLVECKKLTGATEGERTPFSAVFRGPMEPVLPQQIYSLECEEIGSLDLFLVPIGPDKTGMQYEAVFT